MMEICGMLSAATAPSPGMGVRETLVIAGKPSMS